MKILVTGSNGMIGRWMVKRLQQDGHSLVTTDVRSSPQEPGREHIPGDITDISLIRRLVQGVDAVIHLAAVSFDMPGRDEELLHTNIRGTWNVLLACVEANVKRMVYFSSINALGQAEPQHDGLYLPLDDDVPHRTSRSYFLSKHISEELCSAFAARSGMTIVSLRPTAVWQPGPSDFPWWGMMSEERKEMIATNDFWSYVDVRDVCEAAVLALSAEIAGHEAFLLTADDTSTDRPSQELVDAYYSHLSWPKADRTAYFAEDTHRSLVDCNKAKRLLGWQPKYSRRDAAAEYDRE